VFTLLTALTSKLKRLLCGFTAGVASIFKEVRKKRVLHRDLIHNV